MKRFLLTIGFLSFTLFFPLCLRAEIAANEIPLFEGVTKTTEQLAADKAFIKEIDSKPGGRAAATDQLITIGWQSIQEQDLPKAVRRFNQAFLLTPNDYRIYWGLGTVSAMIGDLERGERLFRKGLTFNRKDIRFISDAGFCLQQVAFVTAQKKNVDPQPKLAEAKKLFVDAIKLDPKAALPHARLAVILFFQGDCAATKKEITTAQKLGGDGLDPKFVSDMKVQCPN